MDLPVRRPQKKGLGTVASPDKKEPADVGQQTPEGSSVGYKRAPRQHRFKAGVSGNRHGRKKGDRNSIALFKEIAMEKVRVRLGEETRIMTRAQAVIYANYAAALKKKSNASANMFLLAEEALEFVDLTDEKQVGCPIGVPARRLTPEEWLSAFGPERKLSED